ncbi:hypothetical protein Bca101_032376 [Brassica carinata]
MIMPTPSSPTRSCFFRDHLVSPVNGCSRYDRILELMRFNDGQQACALLGTGHVFESSTARSLFLASSSDSNSEKREENRGTSMGHNQLGLSLCSAHSLITSLRNRANLREEKFVKNKLIFCYKRQHRTSSLAPPTSCETTIR